MTESAFKRQSLGQCVPHGVVLCDPGSGPPSALRLATTCPECQSPECPRGGLAHPGDAAQSSRFLPSAVDGFSLLLLFLTLEK